MGILKRLVSWSSLLVSCSVLGAVLDRHGQHDAEDHASGGASVLPLITSTDFLDNTNTISPSGSSPTDESAVLQLSAVGEEPDFYSVPGFKIEKIVKYIGERLPDVHAWAGRGRYRKEF